MTDDLIKQLERAKQPTRSLDNEIWALLGQPLPDDPVECPARYTESIDAALTLIPKGWEWSVSTYCGMFGATCGRHAADFKGHTAPLAICIAAVKAIIASAST
jgi:hypothetical protein